MLRLPALPAIKFEAARLFPVLVNAFNIAGDISATVTVFFLFVILLFYMIATASHLLQCILCLLDVWSKD
jgi:predicted PurR-regulated permease PerM